MRAFEPWHLIVLIVVIALLFGSKRLPDAARGLGRSMRIFKAEVKEMRDEDGHRGASGRAESASGSSGSPGSTASTARPEPLEGRVVEGDGGRTGAPSEQRRDL